MPHPTTPSLISPGLTRLGRKSTTIREDAKLTEAKITPSSFSLSPSTLAFHTAGWNAGLMGILNSTLSNGTS